MIVRTVLGDIDPSVLGITHTHEHLIVAFGRWQGTIGKARAEVDDPRARRPMALDTIGWVRRNWHAHPDNSVLDDVDLAIAELARFKAAGGGAIVDATNPDLNRDPVAVARISRETGVHIVLGCGRYIAPYQPLDMDMRDEDALSAEIVTDITEGCDGTSIRAGIIGEIGLSAPSTKNERRALRAAVRAQRHTGAALLIHPGRATTSPFEAMQIVNDTGGDPERTIISHLDRTLFDPADLLSLAGTGCYLEFDLFGQESSFYPLAPIDMPNDATRIDHLRRLVAAGYGAKLLVAHDICHKTSLTMYGGDGYAHILENVVPLMRRKGMTEAEIDAILVGNPARALAFNEEGGNG